MLYVYLQTFEAALFGKKKKKNNNNNNNYLHKNNGNNSNNFHVPPDFLVGSTS